MKKLLIIIFLTSLSIVQAEPQETEFSTSIGIGGIYGITGINISYNVYDHLFLSAGLGMYEDARRADYLGQEEDWLYEWAAGAYYYFREPGSIFRPRINLFYGPNSIYEHTRVTENGKIIGKVSEFGKGLAAGPGVTITFGEAMRFGLEFDVIYAITAKPLIEDERFFPVSSKGEYTFNLGLRLEFSIFRQFKSDL